MSLVEFELKPVPEIEPWGTAPKLSLHWFGLSDGAYHLELGASHLLEYASIEGWPRFVEYQVARLHEDFISMLPDTLETVPPGVAADDHPSSLRSGGCSPLNAKALAGRGVQLVEIADLSSTLYSTELHEGVRACSVGWLGSTVPTKGAVGANLLQALRYYSRSNYHEDWLLGYRTCETCDAAEGHGEFSIEWGGTRYVLPVLVLHYCEAHEYLPPAEFIRALAARWEADASSIAG